MYKDSNFPKGVKSGNRVYKIREIRLNFGLKF